uniref:Uncharacterized protein n=1 Tax=Sphaerodactylus townsendi TaxID=933632 RepID=A0ACB8FCX2_9SAUR
MPPRHPNPSRQVSNTGLRHPHECSRARVCPMPASTEDKACPRRLRDGRLCAATAACTAARNVVSNQLGHLEGFKEVRELA